MIEPNQDDVQEPRDRTTSTKPSPSAQSTVIGRFKIVRFLAQGSYCRVYESTKLTQKSLDACILDFFTTGLDATVAIAVRPSVQYGKVCYRKKAGIRNPSQ